MADIGDYRYRIPGGAMPEITAGGLVNFDIYVEALTAEGWELIDGGHFTQQIPGARIEACGTANQAKAMIAEYVTARGLALADRALRALKELLPGGAWPENDVTQPLIL